MKGKMLVLASMATLAIVCSVLTSAAFQSNPKNREMVNRPHNNKKKSNFWVHRRDPGSLAGSAEHPDFDQSNALALAVQIRKTTGGQVEAQIWRYIHYANGKYRQRQPAINATGGILKNSEDDSRQREMLTLEDASGDVIGYVTFYKGKGKGAAHRNHTRAIFRWNEVYAAKLRGAAKEKLLATGGCDAPPEDDPMEEEDMTFEEIPGEPQAPTEPLDDPFTP